MRGVRLTREEALAKGLEGEELVVCELERLGARGVVWLGNERLGYDNGQRFAVPVDVLVNGWEGPPPIHGAHFGVQVKLKQPRSAYPDTGYDWAQHLRYDELVAAGLRLAVVYVTPSWEAADGSTLHPAQAARLGTWYGAWHGSVHGRLHGPQIYFRLRELVPLQELLYGHTEQLALEVLS